MVKKIGCLSVFLSLSVSLGMRVHVHMLVILECRSVRVESSLVASPSFSVLTGDKTSL